MDDDPTDASPSASSGRSGEDPRRGSDGIDGAPDGTVPVRTPGRSARPRDPPGAAATTPGTDAADRATTDPGTVSLVGSGPGDPELLTRRAWRRLSAADVVLHDSLTGDGVVAAVPDATEVIDVGKRPPDRTSQADINALMCERSRRGERVVRLKGGDPNVFGRGGEEAEHLASEGVPFEVVPGVSSVQAAAGVSGVPLTHRETASSVTVVTGHETPEKAESALDWAALADTVTAGGTLVVLMGVRRLAENVAALRDHGLPGETPVATVQRATWEDEQTVVATLDDIVAACDRADVESPAVTIVGEVVRVRETVEDLHRHDLG